jgi:hypothetical protein
MSTGLIFYLSPPEPLPEVGSVWEVTRPYYRWWATGEKILIRGVERTPTGRVYIQVAGFRGQSGFEEWSLLRGYCREVLGT